MDNQNLPQAPVTFQEVPAVSSVNLSNPTSLLTYGGISVAVILAASILSKTIIDGVVNLVEVVIKLVQLSKSDKDDDREK